MWECLFLNQYALKNAFCREEWDRHDWGTLEDGTQADAPMREILLPSFWTSVECCVDFFKPLWVRQRKADTDGPSYVSFCYPDMLDDRVHIDSFKGPLPHRQQAEALTIFSLRWEKLRQPLLSAAYVLHPAYTLSTLCLCLQLLRLFLKIQEDTIRYNTKRNTGNLVIFSDNCKLMVINCQA